jgi:hypothetical protein
MIKWLVILWLRLLGRNAKHSDIKEPEMDDKVKQI